MKTINELITEQLERNYRKVSRPFLTQIQAITNDPQSDMQLSLQLLDTEAERLDSDDERFDTENEVLQETLEQYLEVTTQTAGIIRENDEEVQDAGTSLAVPALTALAFLSLTESVIANGGNPLTSTNAMISVVASQGVNWNVPNIVGGYIFTPEWIEKLDQWGAGYAELTEEMILNGFEQGWGPIKLAREMRRHAENIPLYASENLTRTLMNTSFRLASAQMELANSHLIEAVVRISALSPQSCLACIHLHGTVYPPGTVIEDHYRGYCELPGNIISGATPTAFISRRYDGDAIVIRTASGKKLSVTPNHPVLSSRGWVAAGLLKIGDDVISYSGGERATALINPNKKHVVSRVEDIPSAFNMTRLGTVPISSQNFHGDGTDGDVGVVWANGELGSMGNVSNIKPSRQEQFGFGTLGFGLPRFSEIALMFKRQRFSSNKFLSIFNHSILFFRRHFTKHQKSGFRYASAFNSSFVQPKLNCTSGYSEGLRNRKLTFSIGISSDNIGGVNRTSGQLGGGGIDSLNLSTFGFTPKQPLRHEYLTECLIGSMKLSGSDNDIVASHIKFDSVVDVSVTSFSGHVYSLQVDKGWYISNGIISHNCSSWIRVIGGPQWPEQMQADSTPGKRNFVPFQKGDDWFNGLSPERQAQQISFLNSPAKWRAFQDGTPLSSFVGNHIDPVFGNQKIELSLIRAIGELAEKYYSKNLGKD